MIGNKVRNRDDINYQITNKMSKSFRFVKDSEYLRKYEQGHEEEFNNFVLDNNEINKRYSKYFSKSTKKTGIIIMKFKNKYIKDDSWVVANFIIKDLTEYIDPEFNYEEVIRCFQFTPKLNQESRILLRTEYN